MLHFRKDSSFLMPAGAGPPAGGFFIGVDTAWELLYIFIMGVMVFPWFHYSRPWEKSCGRLFRALFHVPPVGKRRTQFLKSLRRET